MAVGKGDDRLIASELSSWEALWAPYDEPTYQDALAFIQRDDVVLDIGAGDCRFARRAAAVAKQVVAIERNHLLLPIGHPENLKVIEGDARFVPFPQDVTVAVLLMRHCTHFQLYAEKLKAVGCSQLVTNARWGMGVECVDLMAERVPFTAVSIGWYACWCGKTGFVPGASSQLNDVVESTLLEVSSCPDCQKG